MPKSISAKGESKFEVVWHCKNLIERSLIDFPVKNIVAIYHKSHTKQITRNDKLSLSQCDQKKNKKAVNNIVDYLNKPYTLLGYVFHRG